MIGLVTWAGYFESLPAFETTRAADLSWPVMMTVPIPNRVSARGPRKGLHHPMPTDACPACGGRDFSLAFDAADHHYGISGTWKIIRCRACGLLRLDPIPTEDELNSFYREDYYSFQPVNSPTGSIRQGLVSAIYPPIGAPEFARPGSMLDIGCGSGEVLAQLLQLGWTAVGVEPSAIACEEGRRNGLDIRNGSLIDAAFPNGELRLCAFIPFV